MKYSTFLLGSLLTFLVQLNANAQNNDPERWASTIKKFEQEDQQSPPKDQVNLFVGSSSIAMWKDIADYFPEHAILNRGFGGSEFSDLLYYAGRVIFPYKPAKIFIYEGDNDIANGKKPNKVFREAKHLRRMIKKELPEVPVVFIAAKPSVARQQFKEEYRTLNRKLERYAKRKKQTYFADVYSAMLDENGEVFDHIFLEDNLHMNEHGYEIWRSVLAPYLTRDETD